MPKRIYLLCPVRKAEEKIKKILDEYVNEIERQGCSVHYPPRDVDQTDATGLSIMRTHKNAMENSDEVHAYWSPNSEGSVCDLGMSLMLGIPFKLLNRHEVEEYLKNNPGKSYTRVAYELDKEYYKK